MTSLPYSRDNLKILGRLFRNFRECKGYSVRGVARSARLSHTVVSDIENCKIHPNQDTLKELYRTVGVSMFFGAEEISSLKHLLAAFNNAVYYTHPDDVDMYYEALKKRAKRLLHSPLRVDFLLAKETYRSFRLQKRRHGILDELEEVYEYLSSEQKQMYNLILGIKYYHAAEYDVALTYLKKNMEIPEPQNFYAVTITFLARVYDFLFKDHRSLKYALEAAKLHTALNNTYRKMEIEVVVVKKHIELGNYEEAENTIRYLKQSLNRTLRFREAFQRVIARMEAYLAFAKGDYEQALAHFETAKEDAPRFWFYQAYLNHEIGNADKARTCLDQIEKHPPGKVRDFFFAAGRLFLAHIGEDIPDTDLENAVRTIYENMDVIPNAPLYYMINEMLIAHHERCGDYKAALEVAKRHLSFYKQRDFLR